MDLKEDNLNDDLPHITMKIRYLLVLVHLPKIQEHKMLRMSFFSLQM